MAFGEKERQGMRRLKDRMHAASGRKMAGRRHRYLEEFLEEFLQEWRGQR